MNCSCIQIKFLLIRNLCSKRQQCQLSQLKMLHAEGNADNRTAQNYSKNCMRNCQLDTAKNQPENI